MLLKIKIITTHTHIHTSKMVNNIDIMGVLVSLVVVIISQCILTSNIKSYA